MKRLIFLGNARAELRNFPEDARRQMGTELRRVQEGLEPFDWKPMTAVGAGVREIRVREASGAYRVLYVAALVEAVYVLHSFQKKTQATPKRDLDLATLRYRLLRQERQ